MKQSILRSTSLLLILALVLAMVPVTGQLSFAEVDPMPGAAEESAPTLTVTKGEATVTSTTGAAISFVNGGEVTSGSSITVKADTVQGEVFDQWQVEVTTAAGVEVDLAQVKSDLESKLTAAESTFTMPACNVVLTAIFKSETSSETTADSSHKPAPTTTTDDENVAGSEVETTPIDEDVNIVVDPDKGAIEGDLENVEPGDTVVVKPVPEEGYQEGGIVVTDEQGNPIEVTKNDDGTYSFEMPEGEVEIAPVFEMIPESDWRYKDVAPNAYFYGPIERLSKAGLLNGVGDKKFSPYSIVNRAMLVTVLHRIESTPAGYTESFDDVPAGTWYSVSVAWAQETGVVKGYSDTKFGPLDALTMEQIVTIIYRYENNKGNVGTVDVNLSNYAGAENVSDYAKEAMAWGIQNGIVPFDDYGRLQPKDSITRAGLAIMVDESVAY